MDDIYEEAFNKAKKQGLLTKEEKENLILENGEWDKNNEKKIEDLNKLIDGLKITLNKIFIKKQKDLLIKDLEKAKKELNILINKKNELIGLTAEIYANKKINEFYMLEMLYKNSSLNELLYTKEDFEELDSNILNEIFQEHEKYINKFSPHNLKKVALCPFFMNLFIISNDNPYSFYGKPVVNLTFFQSQVYEYARTFKNILSSAEANISEEIMSDPDKLMDWYNSSQAANKVMEKSGMNKRGGNKEVEAMSLVGASKEDLKNLGLETNDSMSNNIIELARKKGGSLNINDIMGIQGI